MNTSQEKQKQSDEVHQSAKQKKYSGARPITKEAFEQEVPTGKPFGYWLKKNKYYHRYVERFYRFIIPEDSRVLQIGCKNSYLLAGVRPSVGVCVDENANQAAQAQAYYSDYIFHDSFSAVGEQQFDYIILSSATMQTYDIQELFTQLRQFCAPHTRIVLDSYSYLWEPVLWITQKLGLRRPTSLKNWVSYRDLQHFLYLADFEPVTRGRFMLLPLYIPLVSSFINSIGKHIPLIKRLCLHEWLVARPKKMQQQEKTVSVIIPCRNEKGNIEPAVLRCPDMGAKTEIIFVEGNSQDDTVAEIKRVAEKYPEKNISWYVQDGKGKGDAVRKGFDKAAGDILMIQDADLTAPPEELPKFYEALVAGKGEFINGSRLVYGMENEAMRFLNLLANFFFGRLFSWVLGQKVKDTLCGTKVLWRTDYKKIVKNRSYFGNFDPFGDFDLLFGAAKLNLKIVDMPVHYKNRTYGSTQIRRFYHGWILLYMSLIGVRKFKFW